MLPTHNNVLVVFGVVMVLCVAFTCCVLCERIVILLLNAPASDLSTPGVVAVFILNAFLLKTPSLHSKMRSFPSSVLFQSIRTVQHNLPSYLCDVIFCHHTSVMPNAMVGKHVYSILT